MEIRLGRGINYFDNPNRKASNYRECEYICASVKECQMYIKKSFNITILMPVLKLCTADTNRLLTPQGSTRGGNTFFFFWKICLKKVAIKTYKIHLHLYIETNSGFTDQPSLYSCSPLESPHDASVRGLRFALALQRWRAQYF